MIKLSNFEKISEDKKCATLRHKDGHEMKILVRALSPIQREQLKRLKMANGGQVKMYDEGSQDSPVSNDDSAPSSSISDAPAPAVPATTININATPPAAPAPVSLPPQNTPPPVVNAPTIEPDNSKIQTNSLGPNPLPAVEAQQQAAQDQAKIDATKSQANQQVTTDQIKALQDNAQFDKSNFDELHQHANDYAAHIQAIDPDRVFKQMGTGEKIANSIGLLVGGFGSAKMFGGTNYAYENLQKSIDRDIDAQKTNNANQGNIYKAYESLYGNGILASKMAKVSMNDLAARKADLISQQVGSAQGQINANNLKAKLMLDNQKNLQDATWILGNIRKGGGINNQNASGQQPKNNSALNGINSAQPPKNNTKSAGYSGGWASQNENGDDEQKYATSSPTPFLKSNSGDIINRLNQNPNPSIAKDIDEIRSQAAKTAQSDKAMQQVHQIFGKLADEETYGGKISRTINPHVVGGLGAAAVPLAAQAVGSALPGLGNIAAGLAIPTEAAIGYGGGLGLGKTIQGAASVVGGETNKQYETDKNSMINVMFDAFGGAVPRDVIEDAVNKNSPEKGDDAKTKLKKHDALIDFIRLKTVHDALDRHGVTNRQN